MLSRNGVVDVSLLDDEELQLLDAEKLSHFETKTVVSGSIVIIIIQVPVFSDKKCRIVKLYPIPNHNGTEIVNLPSTVLVCGSQILTSTYEVVNDQCLHDLFSPFIKNCVYQANNYSGIISDESGIIITVNLEKSIVNCSCNSELIIIHGHNLIKFNNCTIRINGKSFVNSERADRIKFLHNTIKEIKPLGINVNISANKFEFVNLKRIEAMESKSSEHSIMHYVVLGILATITFIFISFKSFKCYFKRPRMVPGTCGGGVTPAMEATLTTGSIFM